MAGEAHITIGVGYSFDAFPMRDLDGYFNSSFFDGHYFDSKLLQLVEPFHGVENTRFAVIARSTARSGDPQEWSHGYGVQSFEPISSDEFAAFAALLDAFRQGIPRVLDKISEFGPIVSITADI